MFGKTCFLLLACALLGANSEGVHPLTDLPAPGDITTGYFFPDHPTKKFTAGKPVNVMLGIRNDASETYNVTAILGSLNSPMDFRMHIQNFTQMIYQQKIAPGEDLSFEYTFTPDHRLEARDFTVALTVVYHNDKDQYFSTTFFNNTVELVEQKQLIDYEMISLVVLLVAMACGAVYLAYDFGMNHLQNMGIVKKQKKTKKVEGGDGPDSTDEWVKGTAYDSYKKKKAVTK
eukprot:gene15427-21510_t